MPNLLEINNLRTSFLTGGGEVKAVRGVSMSIGRSESVGIVGESGSGKSVTFLSVLRLLASTGRIQGGEILFEGKDNSESLENTHADPPFSQPRVTYPVRLMPSNLRATRCTFLATLREKPFSPLVKPR